MGDSKAERIPNVDIESSVEREGSHPAAEERSQIKEASQEIGEAFVKLYGEYMPPEKRGKEEISPDKILVLPDEEYANFRKKLEKSKRASESSAPAYYDSEEDLIVINKDYVKKIAESTEFAGTSKLDVYSGLIALGFAHRLQDHSKARMFLELGSSYYAREVLKSMKRRMVAESINTRRANLYGELVNEAGDRVHKTFFGTGSEVDKYYVYGILNQSREQLLDLFPEIRKS